LGLKGRTLRGKRTSGAKQAAEKSDFGKTAKNKSRQDALGAIRWVSVMILYLHFWGHLCPIPTFSAACKAVKRARRLGHGFSRAFRSTVFPTLLRVNEGFMCFGQVWS
jgi:hypothetical protein